MQSRTLQRALENLGAAIREVEAVLQEMRTEQDPLAVHIYATTVNGNIDSLAIVECLDATPTCTLRAKSECFSLKWHERRGSNPNPAASFCRGGRNSHDSKPDPDSSLLFPFTFRYYWTK